MDYHATIKTLALDLLELEVMLARSTAVEQAGPADVLRRLRAKLRPGWEVDVDVVNSESGPYVNAVLYQEGCERRFLEPGYTLLGHYVFDAGRDGCYHVTVEVDAEQIHGHPVADRAEAIGAVLSNLAGDGRNSQPFQGALATLVQALYTSPRAVAQMLGIGLPPADYFDEAGQ